jgi:hypothetical protein
MKKITINTLAFLAIGMSAFGIYNATEQKIAELHNYDAVIVRNALTDTYKLKIFANSEEFVQPIEYKDVMTIMKIDREVSESQLEEAKKELEEMKILEKLINSGIELTEEQLKEVLPRAAKKMEELDEPLEENPLPSLSKKPSIRI